MHVTLNICGFPVGNLLHFFLLTYRVLRQLLEFVKLVGPWS